MDFCAELLERVHRGERYVDEEVLLVSPDGVQRHLAVSGSPVVNAAGRVALAVMVFRDVTVLRQLEAARRQYVSLISHDLRGPLLAAKLSGEIRGWGLGLTQVRACAEAHEGSCGCAVTPPRARRSPSSSR